MLKLIERKGPGGRLILPEQWPKKYDKPAVREGWFLFPRNGLVVADRPLIQRLDEPHLWIKDEGHTRMKEPLFKDDADAVAFVRRKAAEGSEMHRLAMSLHVQQTMYESMSRHHA